MTRRDMAYPDDERRPGACVGAAVGFAIEAVVFIGLLLLIIYGLPIVGSIS